VKYLAERRHIVNNWHQHGRLASSAGRRSTADAVFKCSLNKRSAHLPVPLSAADRRQLGPAATANGAQVSGR